MPLLCQQCADRAVRSECRCSAHAPIVTLAMSNRSADVRISGPDVPGRIPHGFGQARDVFGRANDVFGAARRSLGDLRGSLDEQKRSLDELRRSLDEPKRSFTGPRRPLAERMSPWERSRIRRNGSGTPLDESRTSGTRPGTGRNGPERLESGIWTTENAERTQRATREAEITAEVTPTGAGERTRPGMGENALWRSLCPARP